MRMNIVKGVGHALSYMHHDCAIPIVHRDISSGNILLDLDYEARISGFGTTKLMKIDTSSWTALAATYELAYTIKVNEKCDVYSFGVVVIEVIKGRHPGDSIPSLVSPDASLKDVLDPRLPVPYPEFEQSLITILQIALQCLQENPNTWPSMKMVSQLLSTLAA